MSEAAAWLDQAAQLDRQGRFDEALGIFDKVLQLQPESAEAYSLRGITLAKLGQLEMALASLDKALQLRPDYADAHYGRAVTLYMLGRLEAALEGFDAAIAVAADNPKAHNNRGITLFKLGRPEAALASYNAALQLDAAFAEACFNKGAALAALGRSEAGLAAYDAAISLNPAYAEAHSNRAATLQTLGRNTDALAAYDMVIRLQPDNTQARINRCIMLTRLERLEEALAAADEALMINPDDPVAHYNRGLVLFRLHRLEDALDAYERAIQHRPDYAEAYNNRGVTLHALMRLEDALNSYDHALRLNPDYAEACYNKSLILIVKGEYLEGWALYEMRLKSGGKNNFHVLDWRGERDIRGKRILIPSEQGMGDIVQFCRYLPRLATWGAEIIFEVPKPLIPLVATLDCPMTIVPLGDPLPAHDAFCPLMSLPHVFRTELETIPAAASYLFCDPAKLQDWRCRLDAEGQINIGLVWSGNPDHSNDHNRSIPLEMLQELISLPANWHSLHKEYRPADAACLAGLPALRQHQAALEDFADTAALISCMDLVITVDTSIAHVAAAVGSEVWVLLPEVPDFRWLLDRDDSPWYPTARLFRQQARGAWQEVIDKVKEALQAKLA